ncbi:hypothetical protein Tco_1217157 [Tanacetum coccineum]
MSTNPKAIALRMDSEPSDQSKRQAATKKRISQHEDYLILKSGSDMDRIDEAEHHEEDGELECKVLKSGCDMVGSIASQHSVEHRRPIKQMVLKSGSDMDGRIAPLHSVQQRWPILHMILKSRRDMDGQIYIGSILKT